MIEKKILPIVMGQYTVVSRKNAAENLVIATPAIQSCIAVVLISDDAVGLAHFDTPVDLERTLNKMIADMRQYGNGPIKAQLIGGIYGFVPYTCSAFSGTIADILNKNNISSEHKHYDTHYSGIPITSLYVMSNLLGYIGPESIYATLFLSAILYTAATAAESFIKDALHYHYNVSIEMKTGKVNVTKNDDNTASKILYKVSSSQNAFFRQRMEKDAYDKNLKYVEVSMGSSQLSQKH